MQKKMVLLYILLKQEFLSTNYIIWKKTTLKCFLKYFQILQVVEKILDILKVELKKIYYYLKNIIKKES